VGIPPKDGKLGTKERYGPKRTGSIKGVSDFGQEKFRYSLKDL
jgi:hypothetical protein